MFWVCAACVWDAVFVAFEQTYAILFALQRGNTADISITPIQRSPE